MPFVLGRLGLDRHARRRHVPGHRRARAQPRRHQLPGELQVRQSASPSRKVSSFVSYHDFFTSCFTYNAPISKPRNLSDADNSDKNSIRLGHFNWNY